ncbi:MAG TPA: OmpA family protein [Nevskiaceae bacterium]
MHILTTVAAALLLSVSALATASDAPATTMAQDAATDRVVIRGTVADDAARQSIVEKLVAIYGREAVIDELAAGGVVTPARWNESVTATIGAELKRVSNGELRIEGTTVSLHGDVPDEATREEVLSSLRRSFDSGYVLRASLRVRASNQSMLDEALAQRTIEFESGSSTLTSGGREILDEMAAAILRLRDPAVQIVGNTDSVGNRSGNLELSLQRAAAAKRYLVSKGVPAATLSVAGAGSDHPIASNDTAEGRARNRRTDFRVADR